MRKIIMMLVCMLAVSNVSFGQNPADILGGDKALTDIYVNPLGIDNAIGEMDFNSLADKASKLGLEYMSINLGQYGNALGIKPNGLSIGGVDVDNLMIMVQDNMNGILYQSASCDNYRDMFDFLNGKLGELPQLSEKTVSEGNLKVYMLSPEYGIAVGAFDQNKMVMTMLMDMRNLFGFLSLPIQQENTPSTPSPDA